MKPTISNLREAQAWQLNELYFAEKRSMTALDNCLLHVSSASLKNELATYRERCNDKILKTERVFSYLMSEPGIASGKVINSLIAQMEEMLRLTVSKEMKDVMLISCLHTLNHYKIAGYSTALRFSEELELDTATDLLKEILNMEHQSSLNLANCCQ